MVTANNAGAGELRAAARARAAVNAGELAGDLFEYHAVRLIRMAVLLLGDQSSAEDVVQDAFLGLYRGASRLRDPANAVAYLRTSVLNGCRSVLRGRGQPRAAGPGPLLPRGGRPGQQPDVRGGGDFRAARDTGRRRRQPACRCLVIHLPSG
jgi:DNA-directed RNA polymerase specialized sigma24 family protein